MPSRANSYTGYTRCDHLHDFVRHLVELIDQREVSTRVHEPDVWASLQYLCLRPAGGTGNVTSAMLAEKPLASPPPIPHHSQHSWTFPHLSLSPPLPHPLCGDLRTFTLYPCVV